MELRRTLIWLLSWIPLVGGLHETSQKDHLEALRELLLGQIVATMPIWIGAIHVAWPALDVGSIFLGIREMSKNGELFIYAAGTLAPIMYIVSRERDIPRAFPNKHLYIGIVWVGTIVAAIVYMLQRVKLQPISETTFNLSVGSYLFAIVVLYLAFVYNNTYLPNPANAMRRDEDDYTRRLKEHR